MKTIKIAVFIVLYNIANSQIVSDKIIAGGKSASDCMNIGGNKFSEFEIRTSDFIRQQGYLAEDQLIETDDGYLLTLTHILGSKGAPAVLLQHGLGGSSFDWVANGKFGSPAFFLADNGYDVWLGNFRGNLYSKCHVKYTTKERKYWDFSFHEMGVYDLPAKINYIKKMNNQSLFYVGHSMGTTTFFIMAIERPDIASKVKSMFSLAPVAYTYHMRGAAMLLCPFSPFLQFYNLIASGEVFYQSLRWDLILKFGCEIFSTEKICRDIAFTVIGFNAPQFNVTRLLVYLHHYPAGTSVRTIKHYCQGTEKQKFRQFDFGKKKNLLVYNSTEPQDYDLSKIQVPIGFFWSENDYLAAPEDVRLLYDSVPNKILDYKIKDPKFNHYDFLIAIDARKLVFEELLANMNKHL